MVILLFAVTSCGEDETPAIQTEDEIVDMETETVMDESFDEVDELSIAGIGAATSPNDGRVTSDERFKCATVTFNLETREVIVDFGEGCEGPMGRVRKGIMRITYQGRVDSAGATITTRLEGFSIDDIGIEGTRAVTTTMDENRRLVFSVKVSDGRITWPDGTFATRQVDRKRVWVRGANPSLDEYHVEGTASGMNRRGINYESEITSPIIFKRNCMARRVFIPTAGEKIIITTNRTITINYGDGDCDNLVTLDIDGNSREVEFQRIRRIRG